MPRPRRGRGGAARAARAVAAPPPSSSPSTAVEQKPETRGRPRGRPRKNPPAAARPSINEKDTIQTADRSDDEALANEDVAMTSAVRTTRASSRSSIELGRFTAAATTTITPGRNQRDTSGLDLGDSVFGDLDDSFAEGSVPGSALSGDVSNMSYSALRSQSRRSSFVGRNDHPIRPSSRTGNTPRVGSSFNLGLFKRRAREPSILGASRVPLQEPLTVEDSEADSEDAFEPEAESTPLNNRRRTQGHINNEGPASPDEAESSNSRKRKSLDTEQSSRGRPGKVSRTEPGPSRQPVDHDASQLPDAPPLSEDEQVDETSESELSEMSLPRDLPARLPPRPVTPVNQEEIVAPPASSGSEGPDVWPDIRTLAKKRRRPSVTTPTRLDNLSDMSSPPSLTHSPNYDAAKTGKPRGRPPQRQQESPKMTTADLTSLLPKRKYKKARDPLGLESDEELDTSGLGHEDDELSHLDTQTARRRKRGRPPTKARSASRGGKRTASSTRPTSYGHRSRHSSDKENADIDGTESENEGDEEGVSRFNPLADDTFDEAARGSADAVSTEELKQASNKFKEVDQWELDFEEVAEPSSPQDGR